MAKTDNQKIEAKTSSIGQMLSSKQFFRIPEYQRPFSWDKEQFDDLIDDLIAADKEQEYFFGTMVLHFVENSGDHDVVDGQQRLTSLMILLACLRDLTDDPEFRSSLQDKILQKRNKADGIPEKVRLRVRDWQRFGEIVVQEGGTAAEHSIDGLSSQELRYLQAVASFREKLNGIPPKDLEQMIEFVSQKCVVVYFSSSSFDDAFRLFSIVNDRGKQLRRIDILKAANIAPGIITTDSSRSALASQWESLEKELGESTFESIFHLLRLILLKDKPQADLLKEFEKRVFGKVKVDGSFLGKGERFFSLAFKYAELYKRIFIDRDIIPEKSPESLKYKALIHIMDAEFAASEWRACLLAYASRFDNKGFYKFCLAIEKVYLQQWVQSVRKDERFSEYAKVLSLIELAKAPMSVTSGVNYDPAPIKAAVGSSNFYNLGFSKYLLLRLELLASEHDCLKQFDAKSVEHVLPVGPDKTGYWADHHDLTRIKEYVDSIGNLVLLSKSKNSSASNYAFERKKEKYLKTKVSDYPRSIQVLKYKDWDRPAIEQRTKEAQQLILDDI
jgi:uncharacterized protein with ParB-like and HNH nuclease domain